MSADGLQLTYRLGSGGQSIRYSLLTGVKQLVSNALRGEPSELSSPTGEVLTLKRTDIRPRLVDTGFYNRETGVPKRAYSNEAWGGRYTIRHQDGTEQELPITRPEGANQGLRGAVAQFSDDGRFVAISHRVAVGAGESVSVTDWRTGDTRLFDGISLAANSVWSPDGARLVVGQRRNLVPQVLDINTGALSSLGGAFGETYGPLTREVIGWLDDEHLIVLELRNRRLLVGAHDLARGEHHPLLDASMTSSLGDFGGMQIAPLVLHALANPFSLSPSRHGP